MFAQAQIDTFGRGCGIVESMAIMLRKEKGMALMLELLLGFLLLSVAVFALFAIFPTGDRAVVRSVRASQANEIARGLMEKQLAREYSMIVDDTLNGEVDSQGMSRGGSDLNTKFIYQVDITSPVAASGPPRRYKNIRVEVHWEEGADLRRHTVLLESSKGEYF